MYPEFGTKLFLVCGDTMFIKATETKEGNDRVSMADINTGFGHPSGWTTHRALRISLSLSRSWRCPGSSRSS